MGPTRALCAAGDPQAGRKPALGRASLDGPGPPTGIPMKLLALYARATKGIWVADRFVAAKSFCGGA